MDYTTIEGQKKVTRTALSQSAEALPPISLEAKGQVLLDDLNVTEYIESAIEAQLKPLIERIEKLETSLQQTVNNLVDIRLCEIGSISTTSVETSPQCTVEVLGIKNGKPFREQLTVGAAKSDKTCNCKEDKPPSHNCKTCGQECVGTEPNRPSLKGSCLSWTKKEDTGSRSMLTLTGDTANG